MQVDDTARAEKPTLTDMLRVRFKGVVDPAARFIGRLGITPNMLTLTGLAGNIVAAFFLSRGELLVGGLIILLVGPLDALDGALARLRDEPSPFGAFLDSVTDRYSELFIFGGLMLYYVQRGDWLWASVVYAAAAGSVLVSYTRARAEGVGFMAKYGLLTRAERFVILIPSLIFNFAEIGLALIAIFANFTALQRIYHVRQQARD
ncbi:MAG: CDP-alcohol phosphatidyltransferase family protein [Anaerolineales bacterium]|jgi:CDP-diacylglycerol--glycerol-3-phosphate 3-phosphatidyltransferase